MMVFYFTATGNSLYVAKRLSGTCCSIPRLLQAGPRTFSDEAIGFVFPCYGFGVPQIVAEFVRQSRFRAAYFFAVMTYGNRSAAGLEQFERLAGTAGIALDYADEVLMVDNYLPWFKVEDQLQKEPDKKIEANLARISADIEARRSKLVRKGTAAKLFSRLVAPVSAALHCGSGDKRFWVQETCNGCRVCERVCPRGNIEVAGGPVFLHRCEGCYACLHHCPQQALHVKSERSKARYLNQHVQLNEIISANCQQK